MGLRLDDPTPEEALHPWRPSLTFAVLLGTLEGSRHAVTTALFGRVVQELQRPLTNAEIKEVGRRTILTSDTFPSVEKDFTAVCQYVRQLEDEVRRLQATVVDLTTR